MPSSDTIGEDIERRLQAFVAPPWNLERLKPYLGTPRFALDLRAVEENLRKPIDDFVMRGGKRLRPRLLLSLAAALKLPYEQCLPFASFVELIHNATLVLDDIEDRAELRRGKPAMHRAFGLDVATNAGFLMHMFPLVLLTEDSGLSENQRLRLWRIYSEEMLNVGFGQAIDIYWHASFPEDISTDEYLEMCRLKTGSLMRMSLRIPCALAGSDAATEERYLRFAESLGIAFQIQDDILDLTATEEVFGKSYGNDITEGKQSLPVVIALTTLPEADRKRLRDILAKHTSDREEIGEALTLISRSHAIEAARAQAAKLMDEAWQTLEETGEPLAASESFKELAGTFIKRAY